MEMINITEPLTRRVLLILARRDEGRDDKLIRKRREGGCEDRRGPVNKGKGGGGEMRCGGGRVKMREVRGVWVAWKRRVTWVGFR